MHLHPGKKNTRTARQHKQPLHRDGCSTVWLYGFLQFSAHALIGFVQIFYVSFPGILWYVRCPYSNISQKEDSKEFRWLCSVFSERLFLVYSKSDFQILFRRSLRLFPHYEICEPHTSALHLLLFENSIATLLEKRSCGDRCVGSKLCG